MVCPRPIGKGSIFVRVFAQLGWNEMVAWDVQHHCQQARIANAALLNLVADHGFSCFSEGLIFYHPDLLEGFPLNPS